MERYHVIGDLDWPLNALRGLSAIAEFLVVNIGVDSVRWRVGTGSLKRETGGHLAWGDIDISLISMSFPPRTQNFCLLSAFIHLISWYILL